MNDDDSDSDLNDVAYIGNEDDERGPGCLIGIAVVLSIAGLIALLIVSIYAMSIGLIGGGAGGPGVVIGYGAIVIACIFGLFAGGASLGMSLKALHQSRRQGRGDLMGFAWMSFGLSLLTIVSSFGLGLAIVLGWMK